MKKTVLMFIALLSFFGTVSAFADEADGDGCEPETYYMGDFPNFTAPLSGGVGKKLRHIPRKCVKLKTVSSSNLPAVCGVDEKGRYDPVQSICVAKAQIDEVCIRAEVNKK